MKKLIFLILLSMPFWGFSQTILSVSPATATAGQTLDVTITGANTHFKAIKGMPDIFFNFSAGSSTSIMNALNIVDDLSLKANITIPAYVNTGDYSVSLSDSIDGKLNLANGFHVQGIEKPALVDISPSTMNAGQTLTVLITGTHTHFNKISDKQAFNFKLNTTGATPLSVVNSFTILNDSSVQVNITLPSNTYTGDYDFEVTTTFDGPLSLAKKLHVKGLTMPSLVSIVPASAVAGQTLDVTISGTATKFSQASSVSVRFSFDPNNGTKVINSQTIQNDSVIKLNITIPKTTQTGTHSVYVNEIGTGGSYHLSGFHITGILIPAITSIAPSTGTAGETLNITINGTHTHFTQIVGKSDLAFNFNANGTTVVNSLTVTNDSLMTANISIPATTYTGDYTLSVTNPVDGQLSFGNGFHVNGLAPPSLISVNPPLAMTGQTLDVTITGASTHFSKTGVGTQVFFNSISGTVIVNSITVLSQTGVAANITLDAPNYAGYVDVVVKDSLDGILSLKNGFYIRPAVPTIYSITPSHAVGGDSVRLDITGVYTHFTTPGNTVELQLGSSVNPVKSVNVLDDTHMSVMLYVPLNTKQGKYAVSVKNSVDGTFTLDNGLFINESKQPKLVSITPENTKPGGKRSVSIAGKYTHFLTNGTTLSFNFPASNPVDSLVVINDSLLLAYITIPSNLPAETYKALVTNSVDGTLEIEFIVFTNCLASFKTIYNTSSSRFELLLNEQASFNGNSFLWTFGDGTSSTFRAPFHQFTKDTIYNVCLNLTTAGGATCSYCHEIGKNSSGPVTKTSGFSMQVTPLIPMGMKKENTTASFLVYPNPANESITISNKNASDLQHTVSIYSIDGRLIFEKTFMKEEMKINISGMDAGMYVLKVNNKEKTELLKFIKE